jgi:hypothetical protein
MKFQDYGIIVQFIASVLTPVVVHVGNGTGIGIKWEQAN